MPTTPTIPWVFSVSIKSQNILLVVLYIVISLDSKTFKNSICSFFFSKFSFIKTYFKWALQSIAWVNILNPSIKNLDSLFLFLLFKRDLVNFTFSLSLASYRCYHILFLLNEKSLSDVIVLILLFWPITTNILPDFNCSSGDGVTFILLPLFIAKTVISYLALRSSSIKVLPSHSLGVTNRTIDKSGSNSILI